MDVYSIKQHIIDNPHYIRELLEQAGYCKLSNVRNDEIRCAYDSDTNSTSVRVNVNTLGASDFGRSVNGDIITLIEDRMNLNFREALKFICNKVGLSEHDIKQIQPKQLPFGGFFKNIGKNYTLDTSINIIDDSVLDEFLTIPSRLFLEDGISIDSQNKYKIGYDCLTGRVTIPHYNTKGDLVGIVGRLNTREIGEDDSKYMPIIPFKKSKVLYGFDKNYRNILNSKTIFLAESEKSVMRQNSMGINVGLAVGGSRISDIQAQNIHSTAPTTVIVGFDEGLDEEHIRVQAKKLKIDNPFIQINVGYIWDQEGLILKKGMKEAPMDKTKKEFEYLVRNNVKWI